MDEPHEIGDWIVISELGSGAFGVVKLWKNKVSNEFIAVKKCRFQITSQISKRQRERWTNEVKIMQSIKNDNIVKFKELPKVLNKELSKYNPTNLPLLSMEYCCKGNLRKFLQKPENVKGLCETEVRYVLGDMCNAVSYLHSLNVTHRDIKPENIVLQETNERSNKTIYKLIDLGYAKELETLVQSFVGTLHYVAPEIFLTENYNYKVDYWSLGIVVFEIITGVHPFLHHLPPVERFKYIKAKSPEIICMHISNGKIKSFAQIVLDNHIGQVFKSHIESWLKLVLQYDPKMRSVRGDAVVDIFCNLKDILAKNIIRICSVYSFEIRSYEIGKHGNTIAELKKLIERDFNIPENDQVFVTENFLRSYSDDLRVKDCFSEINHKTTLYVFRKGDSILSSVIILPEQIKLLFENGHREFSSNTLKQLLMYSVYFISRENELWTTGKAAFLLQMDYMEFLFKEEMQLFFTVRSSVQKLTAQIECLDKINRKFMDIVDTKNKKCSCNLNLHRKYLRQSKELIENVNSLTERHLKLLKKKIIFQEYASNLRNFLNETNLEQLYFDAIRLYELGTTNSVQDVLKILSNVIKIKYKLSKSSDIRNYLLLSWKLMTAFQKRFTWMEALQSKIDEISDCMCQNACDKFELICDKTVDVQTEQTIRISFLEETEMNENYTTDHIIKENIDLRYDIQDLVNEALNYRKRAFDQNGIKQDQQNERIYANSF